MQAHVRRKPCCGVATRGFTFLCIHHALKTALGLKRFLLLFGNLLGYLVLNCAEAVAARDVIFKQTPHTIPHFTDASPCAFQPKSLTLHFSKLKRIPPHKQTRPPPPRPL